MKQGTKLAAMPSDTATGFRWLRTGDEAFAEMLAAIGSARLVVKLESYIYDSSPIGMRFREALVAACQRGVNVRVLIDAFGSITLMDSFWEPLRQAGGQARWFNPLSLRRFGFRDHRKLLACDDRVAFVGGFNIAAAWEGDGVGRGWRDLGLQLHGPLVGDLSGSFDEMFARADFLHRRFTQWRRQNAKRHLFGGDGELLLSGPGRGRSTIKRALRHDLARARDVQIIAAYFLPPRRLRRALTHAARRGTRVQLILPGKSDVPLMQLAARSLYTRLLRAGVEIYEYQPQILHSKLVIIDDVVYSGSSNLDTRSLNINYELLLRLPKHDLAAEAREVFAADLSLSQQIHRLTWRKSRTFWNKLKERWAYFFFAKLDPYIASRQLQGMR
jgi:cardiolipin synthase